MFDCFDELRRSRAEGGRRGLYSVCSSNPIVLEATLRRATTTGKAVLVEATANQVNQEGGYTGMRPEDFAARLRSLCMSIGTDPGLVTFGGDHLGPYPWRAKAAEVAMSHAEELVRRFVLAGARKIHLDASMVLGDDSSAGATGPSGLALDPRVAAKRSARLCAVAEAAFRAGDATTRGMPPPVYVIGTEVPVPGGAREEEGRAALAGPRPTEPKAFRESVELHREAFEALGLREAWDRVLAVVVQPGVEFDARNVYGYDPSRAAALIAASREYPRLLLEGHSTDYQSDEALAALVRDGICLLKVGPALTFALREALFGLDAIAGELGLCDRAGLVETVLLAMRDDPSHWKDYYPQDASLAFSLKFAYSDRIRYYWDKPAVSSALARLFDSLRGKVIPLQLMSQYLPRFGSVHEGGAALREPRELAIAAVDAELRRYEAACYP
jgi:D-tagatose-bisphosphate aldolase class II non-catalytic subunit